MQHPHDLEREVISEVNEFASSIRSGRKVVSDMSSLVAVTSRLPLSNLDYWERLIRNEYYSTLESSNPPKWKMWAKPTRLLTWLDLISWDGYKRENTLRTITGAAPNSFFFTLALRRLNDWVPQVRAAARDRLPFIVKESNPVHIVDALCVTLSHWNSWGRIEEEDKEVLLEIISQKDIGEVLKSKIISSPSGPMASLMMQAGRTSVLDEHLDEIAENAIQPSVRARAYRSQLERRLVWVEGRKWEWTDIQYCKGRLRTITGEREILVEVPFIELLQNSANDSSSIVRRVAAEFLIRELNALGNESLGLAKRFASDKSSPVAERGRFALKKLEEVQA